MSTHAIIALDLKTGNESVDCAAIYCHNDGYPSYLYHMLNNHYNDLDRVLDLISCGDASIIKKRLVPSENSGHSFSNPEKDVCIFYHRDRGDTWDEAAVAIFKKEQLLSLKGCDYIYIFENNAWHLYVNGKESFNYDG